MSLQSDCTAALNVPLTLPPTHASAQLHGCVEEQGGGCTSASGQPGLLEDQESATKRQFFDYICTSYRYFLAGDDA
eukprot:scaffold54285_cov22-Tisochrysis_lutea.AAC.1